MARPSPLILVPMEIGQKFADRFRPLISRLLAIFPSVKYDLKSLGIPEAEAYVASNLISSFFLSLVFGAFVYASIRAAKDPTRLQMFAPGIVVGVFLAAFVFNMLYPGLKTRTSAIKMDRDLSFALKDMLVQVESGIPLYEAMVNIAHSNYGSVSPEFNSVVKEISAGMPESLALQKMALKTKSEYFRKALWQLISSLESGASIGPALRSVIETLDTYQRKSIKDYSASLNFIVLIYMLTAAAIPSMGITLLIVLSAFGGIGVSDSLIAGVIMGSLMAQLIIIGYVNSGRPAVYD